MIFSDKYKFIFVHISRCGGTSFRRQTNIAQYEGWKPVDFPPLMNYIPYSHMPAQQIRQQLEFGEFFTRQWDDYFTFAFTRDPWERLHSVYYNQKRMHNNMPDITREPEAEFRDWLERYIRDMKPQSFFYAWWGSSTNPLVDYLCDIKERQRFIELHIEPRLDKKIPPIRSNEVERPDHRTEYTPAMVEAVAEFERDVIEEMGYEYTG